MILVLLLLTFFLFILQQEDGSNFRRAHLLQLSLFNNHGSLYFLALFVLVSPVGAKHSSGSEAYLGGVEHGGPEERLVLHGYGRMNLALPETNSQRT